MRASRPASLSRSYALRGRKLASSTAVRRMARQPPERFHRRAANPARRGEIAAAIAEGVGQRFLDEILAEQRKSEPRGERHRQGGFPAPGAPDTSTILRRLSDMACQCKGLERTPPITWRRCWEVGVRTGKWRTTSTVAAERPASLDVCSSRPHRPSWLVQVGAFSRAHAPHPCTPSISTASSLRQITACSSRRGTRLPKRASRAEATSGRLAASRT